MTGWLDPETFDVPVDGGDLRVARWGKDGPTVLALHGITASHLAVEDLFARVRHFAAQEAAPLVRWHSARIAAAR